MRFLQPVRSARRFLVLIGVLLAAVSGTCLAQNTCQLKSPSGHIKLVIYVQFDNTHFLRDNPNVPSDLEQMPHLLSFIRDNGALLAKDHTVLISHTATGILTSLGGLTRTAWGSRCRTASVNSRPTAPPGPASRSTTGPRPSLIRAAAPPGMTSARSQPRTPSLKT